MARSLWHGAISFGLIYVPVDLYPASIDHSLPLHMLDSRDFSPVGYHRVNKRTGKEVDWAHVVKGYEYQKGRYVALSDADFKHANVKASETIGIVNFTDSAQIPSMYFDTPYYLAPGKGGEKVYTLLRKALQETDKVALATFVLRGRQHLCAVAPQGESLVLLTLRFADELLPPVSAKSAGKAAGVSAAELAMAKQLVQGMSGKFDPARFKDTYRSDLLRRIKEKIKKNQIHSLGVEKSQEANRPKAQVIDLMEALKSSLKMRGKSVPRAAPKRSVKLGRRA
jgi:DNA end-binding protein Ku